MYVNKCIKCGREFETKNPKRVICPDCLYPDKKMMVSGGVISRARPGLAHQECLEHPDDDTGGRLRVPAGGGDS